MNFVDNQFFTVVLFAKNIFMSQTQSHLLPKAQSFLQDFYTWLQTREMKIQSVQEKITFYKSSLAGLHVQCEELDCMLEDDKQRTEFGADNLALFLRQNEDMKREQKVTKKVLKEMEAHLQDLHLRIEACRFFKHIMQSNVGVKEEINMTLKYNVNFDDWNRLSEHINMFFTPSSMDCIFENYNLKRKKTDDDADGTTVMCAWIFDIEHRKLTLESCVCLFHEMGKTHVCGLIETFVACFDMFMATRKDTLCCSLKKNIRRGLIPCLKNGGKYVEITKLEQFVALKKKQEAYEDQNISIRLKLLEETESTLSADAVTEKEKQKERERMAEQNANELIQSELVEQMAKAKASEKKKKKKKKSSEKKSSPISIINDVEDESSCSAHDIDFAHALAETLARQDWAQEQKIQNFGTKHIEEKQKKKEDEADDEEQVTSSMKQRQSDNEADEVQSDKAERNEEAAKEEQVRRSPNAKKVRDFFRLTNISKITVNFHWKQILFEHDGNFFQFVVSNDSKISKLATSNTAQDWDEIRNILLYADESLLREMMGFPDFHNVFESVL